MKALITIFLLCFLSLTAIAQRDTIIISKINQSDTITRTQSGGDTTIFIKNTISGVEFQKIYTTDQLRAILDSLKADVLTKINFNATITEVHYQNFQESNSILYNWKRELARLEDLYNTLYP
jgi:hypothetical protein